MSDPVVDRIVNKMYGHPDMPEMCYWQGYPHPYEGDSRMTQGCAWRTLHKWEPEHTYTPPDLPYGSGESANSGYAAGVTTSQERAVREDSDGTTAQRQERVLDALGARGLAGATWREIAEWQGLHHGQASGVLSGLHKVGKIARLTDRRDRCFVYVLPEYVEGRETQEQGKPKRAVLTDPEAAQVRYVRSVVADNNMFTVPKWRAEQLLAIIDRLTS